MFKMEGLTFTYYQPTLRLMVQGKETKISIATKIIDEKLSRITQEDLQEKWPVGQKVDRKEEES